MMMRMKTRFPEEWERGPGQFIQDLQIYLSKILGLRTNIPYLCQSWSSPREGQEEASFWHVTKCQWSFLSFQKDQLPKIKQKTRVPYSSLGRFNWLYCPF